MIQLKQFFLAAVVALCAASAVQAQPPGGFRGPRGGMEMMGRGADRLLLALPEVQKELNVTEEQKGLIDDMLADLREGGPGFDREQLRDASPEERQKLMQEARAKADARMKQAEEATKTILDEKQFARYEQLRIQRAGVAALGRPEVAEKLALTQEQQDKLAEVRGSLMPERGGPEGGRPPREGRPDGDRPPRGERPEGGRPEGGRPPGDGERPDFRGMMAEMEERRAKFEADSIAVLTPEQKTKWEEMKGEKFTFPPMGFGGRPRGEGGDRPERRRPE